MDSVTRSAAQKIPTNGVKFDNWDDQMVTVLVWSVQNDQPELRDMIKQVLLERKAQLLGSINLDDFELVSATLGYNDDADFWFNQLASKLRNPKCCSNFIGFFKVLMQFTYPADKLLQIEVLCIQHLKRTYDEKFLQAMMEQESLPVEKNGKALSSDWYLLLDSLMSICQFKLFRMIVADWWNFKVRTDLCHIENGAGSLSLSVQDRPHLSLLAAAFRANTDMAWLLAGRTWFFIFFRHPRIRANRYVVRLFDMIPELKAVPWNSPTFDCRAELTKYLRSLEETYPNNVNAQVLILTSSLCPLDITQYIKDAIKFGHVNRVAAAAKSNKLLPEHLHLVHGGGDQFKPAYPFIHCFLGQCDITKLEYRSHGRVVMLVYARTILFSGRALKLMDWIVSRMGTKMHYMNILMAIDRVYAMQELEQKVLAELQESLPELSSAFQLDPALIPDDGVACQLLMYYSDNGYSEFASELILRSTSDRLFFLFREALTCRDHDLIILLQNTITRRNDLSIEHHRQLYEICAGLFKSAENTALVHTILQAIDSPVDWFFIKESILQHNLPFFSFILNEKPYIPTTYIDIASFVQNHGDEDAFECLWPYISYVNFGSASIRLPVFDWAIMSGKTRIIALMLKRGIAPNPNALIDLACKRDFAMIEVLLKSPCTLDWSIGDNVVFNTAVEHGQKGLARILLQYIDVFRCALQSDEALAVFPELKQLKGLPVKIAHRQYLKQVSLPM